MSIKSGVFGAITTVVLTLLLGNRWVLDEVPGRGPAPAALRSITAFFVWDPDRVGDQVRVATYLGLLVLVATVFVLGGIAGRARPLAAFVGGWGAAVGAAALGSIVFSVVAGDRALFGPSDETLDRVYFAMTDGAGVMVALGWLVGVAVLLGSFGAKQPKVAGPVPPPPGPSPYGSAPPVGGADGAVAFGSPAPGPVPPPGAPPTAPPPPPTAPPPASPGGPVIGAPPDRTQVQHRPPS